MSALVAGPAPGVTGEVLVPPPGRSSLERDKLRPVCEQGAEQQALPHAYTLAQVDVSAFKSFLLNLPESHWEDEHAGEENVKLTRPAHDAWGIKKIVFTFCDDFLQKVFDLPYSQNEEWRAFLLPIYAAAGVSEDRVVRSLLASMPPGVDIPVHHDTGYWVKHTHRVHVAIVSSSSHVDFLVGPSPDKMRKVMFDEGRIVELNNQAKHAVSNNWDRPRVHLIFDYVEDHPVTRRYRLRPGDQVRQTRRSIDLVAEEGTGAPSPTFIVLGAQKCGTTSVYEYLCSHPLVIKGKRRETHYFDWRWNRELAAPGAAGDAASLAHHNYYLNFFEQEALKKHPSLQTGESTPSYLLHSDVVLPRLERICPWARLVVMLRNPIDRAYSQFQMSRDTTGTPEQLRMRGMSAYAGRSFEEIVFKEIADLEAAGISPSSSDADFRTRCLEPIQQIAHGGHSIVLRGLYALQLRPWLASPCFGHDSIRVVSIGEIKGGAKRVQATMDKIFAFVGLPPHEIEEQQLDAKNVRGAPEPMPAHVRERLQRFYQPFNEQLFAMLGRDLSSEW